MFQTSDGSRRFCQYPVVGSVKYGAGSLAAGEVRLRENDSRLGIEVLVVEVPVVEELVPISGTAFSLPLSDFLDEPLNSHFDPKCRISHCGRQ